MMIEGLGFPMWVYPAVLWSIIWMAIGMWRSARNNQPGWFLVFLIVNSFGILPIIYLVWFDNRGVKSNKRKIKVSKKKSSSKKSKISTLS